MYTREQEIRQITIIGAVVNIVLTIFKIIAGILGRSAAMVADAVHSLSDLLSDIVVIIFTHISSKKKDRGHSFGHGKFETLATLIVSLILVVVGARLMSNGINSIIDVINGKPIPVPGAIALWAAVKNISKHMEEVTGRRTLYKVIGTDVPHAHVHLMPFDETWEQGKTLSLSEDEFNSIREKLSMIEEA